MKLTMWLVLVVIMKSETKTRFETKLELTFVFRMEGKSKARYALC